MTFALTRPSRPSPLIVEVPHAGTEVPDAIDSALCAGHDDVLRDADLYVDELFADAPRMGGTLLAARLSRYVVDLNRFEHEYDAGSVRELANEAASYPRGVVWRETGRGQRALVRSLSAREFHARMGAYYQPYHAALERELTAARQRHGFAVMLCAHSMPSTGRIFAGTHGVEPPRADVVPGTRGRTSAAQGVIALVEAHFLRAGLTVRIDDPYRGGATTARWGKPGEGFHVVQVELNRRLYMNEQTLERKTDGFAWVKGLCASLTEQLANLDIG